MPNWCYTNISICHDDENKLKDFYNKVEKWLKKTYIKNGFDCPAAGCYWLGNIVGNAGIAKWKKISEEHSDFVPNINCRGTVNGFEYLGKQINVNTETAWAPMLRMWEILCEKFLPDADIFFSAEEGGMGIYWTNDPDMIGRYYIDVCDSQPDGFEDIDSEYEASEEYVVQLLQRILKTDENDINKLINQLEESDNEWIFIHEWTEVSIADCD